MAASSEVKKRMVLLHVNDGRGREYRTELTTKLKDEFGQAQRIQQGNSAKFRLDEVERCDVMVTDSEIIAEAYRRTQPDCDVRLVGDVPIMALEEKKHGSKVDDGGKDDVQGTQAEHRSVATGEAQAAAAPNPTAGAAAAAAPRRAATKE